jgi:hypothetical protein
MWVLSGSIMILKSIVHFYSEDVALKLREKRQSYRLLHTGRQYSYHITDQSIATRTLHQCRSLWWWLPWLVE